MPVKATPGFAVSREFSERSTLPRQSASGQANTCGTFWLVSRSSTPRTLGNTSFQTPSVSNIKENISLKPAASGPSASTVVAHTSEARLTTPMPNRSIPTRKTPPREFATFKSGSSRLSTMQRGANARLGPSADGVPSASHLTRRPTRRRFSDLSMSPRICLPAYVIHEVAAPDDGKTLASSGLRPGTHSLEVLAGMGMCAARWSRYALVSRLILPHSSHTILPTS